MEFCFNLIYSGLEASSEGYIKGVKRSELVFFFHVVSEFVSWWAFEFLVGDAKPKSREIFVKDRNVRRRPRTHSGAFSNFVDEICFNFIIVVRNSKPQYNDVSRGSTSERTSESSRTSFTPCTNSFSGQERSATMPRPERMLTSTIDKCFQRKEAKNTYNKGAKIGEVHSSNRTFAKGVRENQNLNISDGTILDSIHGRMSLEQAASYVLSASKQQFTCDDDMMMKAATISSSLEKCWPQIGRQTPQTCEHFLAQVKKQAPSHRPTEHAFIDMVAAFSKSNDGGVSGDGLSSDAALVICDDESSNCDDAMVMLVGEEASLKYTNELKEAEDLGGYGADGGRGINSAEGRQREGMMAHMKMISSCRNNDRFNEIMLEESEKLSRIDPSHIHGLAAQIQEAPCFIRGKHARHDCNLGDDFLTPDDVTLTSVHCPISGCCFIDGNSVFKVVGFVKGAYRTEGDSYENNLIALSLGTEANVRRSLLEKDKLTTVKGRLEGIEVEGLAYPRMMLVTDDMWRYVAFVNFNPIPGEESRYFTHVGGELAPGHNEWRPREFSCLEYIDWNTSN